MTYPESANVAVVNVLPPSLLILAIISVFKVGEATSSSKITIRDVVGTLPAAKGSEAINVVVVVADLQAVINTYPSSPSVPPGVPPSFVPELYPHIAVPQPSTKAPSSVDPEVTCG